MTVRTSEITAASAAGLLDAVRENAPLVQAITNAVVTGFTANVLLAIGASAAMVDIPEEAGPFAAVAGGVLVNLGTPHAEQRAAALEAARAAGGAGTPWVLDPVAVGTLPVRTALAAELLQLRPTVIRGNPSEIIAVAGRGSGGRGVDSTDDPEGALASAQHLARATGAVVAVSGAVDVITDGTRVVRAGNGHPLLTRITGGGCALGAVLAAFAAVARGSGESVLVATVAGVTAYNIAAEGAAGAASGPGSFAVSFLDRLAEPELSDAVRSGAVLTEA